MNSMGILLVLVPVAIAVFLNFTGGLEPPAGELE